MTTTTTGSYPADRAPYVPPTAASRSPSVADALEARPTRWRPLPAIALARDGRDALRAAVAEARPVVCEDLAADWPALETWAPDRLAARFGDRRVRVYDASFGAPGAGYMGSIDEMRFDDFLAATLDEGRDLRMFLYNLAQRIPELLDDVRVPELGLRFSRAFVFAFLGCRGSTTPLHYDIDMGWVLHTVIRGRRRIRLFAPDDARALYHHPCTVRSYVDLDAPDLDRHPAFARAEGYEVVLEAGESLLLPPGWWHEFHYLDGGMGVSLRAASPRLRDRFRGAAQLLLTSPVDRIANRIAPTRWFAWKTRRADARAAALLREDAQP